MGLFSGYLIVSDIDGTLYDSRGQLSEENRLAIERFKSEGGRFTVASGRGIRDVTEIDETLHIANAPLIATNGTVMGREHDVVWQCRFDGSVVDTVTLLLDNADYCDVEFSTPRGIAVYRPNLYSDLHRKYVLDPFWDIASLDEIPEDTSMVAFWMAEEDIPRFKKLFSELGCDQKYDAFQGFRFAYEMVPKGEGKGAAARVLKEQFDCHTLVCAGDSGNDVSMLLAADYSFAPSGAMDEAKEAAQTVLTRSCDEAIYPEILERLLSAKTA